MHFRTPSYTLIAADVEERALPIFRLIRNRRGPGEAELISEVDAEALYGDPSKAYPGRLSLYWIRFVSKHIVWTHIAATLVVFSLISWFLYAFPLDSEGFWIDLMRELSVAVVATLLPILGTVAALNRPLRPMLKIIGQSSAGGGVIVAFFGDTFMRMGINLVQLRDGGAELEPWQVTEWVR